MGDQKSGVRVLFRSCLAPPCFIGLRSLGPHLRKQAKMAYGPMREGCSAFNQPPGDRAENSRIIRAAAAITQYKIASTGHLNRAKGAQILMLCWDVRLGNPIPI